MNLPNRKHEQDGGRRRIVLRPRRCVEIVTFTPAQVQTIRRALAQSVREYTDWVTSGDRAGDDTAAMQAWRVNLADARALLQRLDPEMLTCVDSMLAAQGVG